MVSHHEVVRDTTESGLARLIGALAVMTPVTGLFQTLVSMSDYRQPAVTLAVWAGLLAAAAWLLPRARLERLARGKAAAAVLIAVAAVTVIGWEHRPHPGSGGVDLAVFGTVGLLALVALSYPAWTWISAALAVFTIHGALVIGAAGAGAASLTQIEAGGYVLATIVFVFAALRPTLAMHTRISARRAALASRFAAERAAADAVRAERRSRLARLEHEALPLLRGIAEGRLDPVDAGVREQCARHAAALRDSLTGPAPEAGRLVAVLGPALKAAQAHGLQVNVQVIGDPGVPAPDVARAVLAAVDGVLAVLPPAQVMLTVIAPGEEVELYLTFSGPAPAGLDVTCHGRDLPAAAGWHAAATVQEDGPGCVEISWRGGSA
ncbi:MAG TPA: hypothetical protein VFQ68_21470 [Streptosporangiaceae bacterium]|nr:hypothetical protein [Streptosporangiaceae bacterium]